MGVGFPVPIEIVVLKFGAIFCRRHHLALPAKPEVFFQTGLTSD
jgi:hypothetical protein